MTTLVLTLPGKVVPKARPRVSRGHAYLPKRYRDWKDGAIAHFVSQCPAGWQPLTLAAIGIQFSRQRGDLDNLAGAVLDALVQAGVLVDDRLTVVRRLSVDSSGKDGVVIVLQNLHP